MAKADYYESLGVGRDASAGDLKSAYRKAAMKFHPDRNPGNSDAEAKFKEINEAYQVLSDPEKRQSYDQFGHDGVKANFQDFDFSNFGGFGDIFDAFFGGSQSSKSSSDLFTPTSISFLQST